MAPSNTGEPSGVDLDRNGTVGGAGDAYGFGEFPGQYGMVVCSKYPIDTAAVRTFRTFLWKDLPGTRLPTGYYPPEDRNGLRNADEIAFWRQYVAPGGAPALVDDAGAAGGLPSGTPFVIMGDYNSDPVDGDSVAGAADQLRTADRVIDPQPASDGAAEAAAGQGGANAGQRGDPRLDTGDFNDRAPGNLRIDYVLPSAPLQVIGSGVFWPVAADPLARLNDTSDHHSVWVDVRLP